MHLGVDVVIFDRKRHESIFEGQKQTFALGREDNAAVAIFRVTGGKGSWEAFNNAYVLKDEAPTYEREGKVGLDSITIGSWTNQGNHVTAKEIL